MEWEGPLLVHMSYEATRAHGGVGTVLDQLLASPAWRGAFPRTLLVSPLVRPSGEGSYTPGESLERELEARGEVLYSGLRRRNPPELSRRLRPVEARHGVSLVYGRRPAPGGPVEVLLVDLTDVLRGYRVFMPTLPLFLERLRRLLGVDVELEARSPRGLPWRAASWATRALWGERLGGTSLVNGLFRRAVRAGWVDAPPLDHDAMMGMVMAEPAFDAVEALRPPAAPGCVFLAQEHLSLPLAYKARLDGRAWSRTVYYAGEVRSPRVLVEYGEKPGQGASDNRFYQVQRLALAEGRTLDEVFPVASWPGFQLLRQGHLCDAVGAVSPSVADELRFLDRRFRARPLTVIPHGHRAVETDWEARRRSRERVLGHLRERLGREFRLLLVRISRDEVCKGLQRDVTVCEFLAERLPPERLPAVLLIITEWDAAGPSRNIQALLDRVAAFNARGTGLHIHLINQARWPEGLDFTRDDLLRATDVSLGQSLYESFGLAQLEPLSCGAVCVISGVSGARRTLEALCARRGLTAQAHPNLVVADYASEADGDPAWTVAHWKSLTEDELQALERRTAERVARQVVERLPRDEPAARSLLETGRQLAAQMPWEPLIREQLIPFLTAPLHEGEEARTGALP
jgi:hypothetical protein